jgi:hypothetical protein
LCCCCPYNVELALYRGAKWCADAAELEPLLYPVEVGVPV